MPGPTIRLRINFSASRALGPGKVGLLEAIDRRGSLTSAAADCGMSYKRAWILLQSTNRLFDVPLATMNKGGRGGGGGATVTSTGRRVIAAYRRAERKATAAAVIAFAGFDPAVSRLPQRAVVRRLSTASDRRRARG